MTSFYIFYHSLYCVYFYQNFYCVYSFIRKKTLLALFSFGLFFFTHLQILLSPESRVVPNPGSRIPGSESRVPTRGPKSQVPLFRYAVNRQFRFPRRASFPLCGHWKLKKPRLLSCIWLFTSSTFPFVVSNVRDVVTSTFTGWTSDQVDQRSCFFQIKLASLKTPKVVKLWRLLKEILDKKWNRQLDNPTQLLLLWFPEIRQIFYLLIR